MGLHLEHRIQFWPPQNKRDMDTLQRGQQRAMTMLGGLERLCYEESRQHSPQPADRGSAELFCGGASASR